ncbi:MAG: hypothetical protein IKJ97_04955, partial [Bacteroidaceae bacterium]|nr:hypothetical protein [Bacteroidaceae bacterium]
SKFLRYVWLQNPHLRLVNCGFEAFTSLELYFLFTPHTKEGDFWVTFICVGSCSFVLFPATNVANCRAFFKDWRVIFEVEV